MTTLRAYFDDAYTSLFSAQIVDSQLQTPEPGNGEPRWQVFLDRTFFYPESGGQPFDSGKLAGFSVQEVVDQEGRIAHVLAAPFEANLTPGQSVEGLVDWNRRHDHMQQHTGQHLLSAVFAELLSLPTLSFHMGDQFSTIELEANQLTDPQIDTVERRTQSLVAEARPVSVSYEDAASISGLRKASTRSGILRVITIADYDRSACGGTHVRTTAEIGPVQIRNLERVRGHMRVEFVCGERARKRNRQDFVALSRLARASSIPIASVGDHMTQMHDRLKTAEKSLHKSNLLLSQAEAKQLYNERSPLADGSRRRGLVVDEITESIRALALAFTTHPRAVLAVIPGSLPGTLILASSGDSGVHAGALWKAAFDNGRGRGGGSGTLAQGSVTDRAALATLLEAAGIKDVHLP